MTGGGIATRHGRLKVREQEHRDVRFVDLDQRGRSESDCDAVGDEHRQRNPIFSEHEVSSLLSLLNKVFGVSRAETAISAQAPVCRGLDAGDPTPAPASPAPRAALLAWAVLVAVGPPAVAKDLGVRGETWPIAEPDLLEQIETRLAALELSGETARFKREAVARARAHVEAPPRVAGVVPATEPRSWLFDPSIVVERDVAAPDGTVIAAAGTRVNPLLARPLSRDVLFVDGARAVEVAWALAHPRPAQIVLVGGRPLALSRAHGRSFFFDQGGALTARLGIAATPARAFQEGAALRIEETPLEDRAPFEAVGRASGSAPVETGR